MTPDKERRGRDGQREAQKLREQSEDLTNRDDLRWLMSDPRGRRFIRRLVAHAGIWLDGYNPNSNEMARAAGRRAMGLWLLQQVDEHCPEQWLISQQERISDRNRNHAGDRNTKQRPDGEQ